MDYEVRLQEYLDRELHPETARNIGAIVAHSFTMSAEGAMGIILELQQDHARRDAELASQVLERTEVAQEYFANRFNGVQ